MIGQDSAVWSPFFFLLSRVLKNRTLSKLRRLRQPRYMVSALAGLVYLYFVFFGHIFGARRAPVMIPVTLSAEHLGLLESILSIVLLSAVLFPWFRPLSRQAPLLTESEVQFLLPAPLTRSAILRFRIMKGQIGILFGVGISVILIGGVGGPFHPLAAVVTLWVVYSFLGLYRIGVTLTIMKAALKNRHPGLGLLAGLLVLVMLLWWCSGPVVLESREHDGPEYILEWITKAAARMPASYLLAPFRFLVRPALAPEWKVFAVSIGPALFILWLTYLWVVRSDVDIGGPLTDAAASHGPCARAAFSHVVRPRRSGRLFPDLGPSGPAWVAFFWKNFLASRRVSPGLAILIFLLVTLALTVAVPEGSMDAVLSAIGGIGLGLAVFFTLMGPVIFRSDFRSDLLYIEALKTLPVRGWQVALGEILSPAVQLAALELASVALAAAFLPLPGSASWGHADRVLVAAGAAALLPCVSLIGLVFQNAAALLLPGWVQIGRESQRGVEAMGQRLIAAVATLFVLIVAGMPAAGVFGVVYFAGQAVLGIAVVPLAACAAATFLMAEAGLGISWLGYLFERLDPSADF